MPDLTISPSLDPRGDHRLRPEMLHTRRQQLLHLELELLDDRRRGDSIRLEVVALDDGLWVVLPPKPSDERHQAAIGSVDVMITDAVPEAVRES